MSQYQVRNLLKKYACQDEKICNLKKRLSSYDEDLAMKDALQKRFDELQRRVEENKTIQKQMNDEQFNIIECQIKKLEKAELILTSLRADNHRLNDINKYQAEQLKALLRTEQIIIADNQRLETIKRNLENNLCNFEDRLRETSGAAEKLTGRLQSGREETRRARQVLEERRAAAGRLRGRCEVLESDAACAAAALAECEAAAFRTRDRCRDSEAGTEDVRRELEDAGRRAAAAAARLRAEADALAEDLDDGTRRLCEAAADRDAWRGRAAQGRCRADAAAAAAERLRAAGARERDEAEDRERRLRRAARDRDAEARDRDQRLTVAAREDEDARAAAAALGARVRDAEGLLRGAARSAAAWHRAQDEARGRLEREKAALAAAVCRDAARAAELERLAASLRDEVRRARDGRAHHTCPAPPPPSPDAALFDYDHQHRLQLDLSGGGATADDGFVGVLERLCRDLQVSAENASRRG